MNSAANGKVYRNTPFKRRESFRPFAPSILREAVFARPTGVPAEHLVQRERAGAVWLLVVACTQTLVMWTLPFVVDRVSLSRSMAEKRARIAGRSKHQFR